MNEIAKLEYSFFKLTRRLCTLGKMDLNGKIEISIFILTALVFIAIIQYIGSSIFQLRVQIHAKLHYIE